MHLSYCTRHGKIKQSSQINYDVTEDVSDLGNSSTFYICMGSSILVLQKLITKNSPSEKTKLHKENPELINVEKLQDHIDKKDRSGDILLGALISIELHSLWARLFTSSKMTSIIQGKLKVEDDQPAVLG